MKQKIKQLQSLLLLLILTVVGTANAWATGYTPSADEVIILNNVYNSKKSSSGYSDHAAIAWGATTSSNSKTAGDPNNGGAATSSNVPCYNVKGNGESKDITVSITGVSKIIIYHESHNKRYIQLKNGSKDGSVIGEGSVNTYYTEVNLDSSTDYSILLYGNGDSGNSDFWVYAIKLVKAGGTTYSVTYHDDGKTSGTQPSDANTYYSGNQVTVLGAGTLVKTNYTLAGWNTASTIDGTHYNVGATFNISGDTNLYPVWKHYVTIGVNDEAMGTASATYRTRDSYYGKEINNDFVSGSYVTDAVQLNLTAVANTGYHFDTTEGWGNATRTKDATGGYAEVGNNNDYVAHFLPNTYNIVFNANGGAGTMSNQAIDYGTTIALSSNTFTRGGYIFTGWNTESNGSGTSYTDGQSVSNLSSTDGAEINLYAQWERVYTVTFNANGGTCATASLTQASAGANIILPTATKENCTFNGWYTESIDGTRRGGAGDSYGSSLAANETLYAQFSDPVVSTTKFSMVRVGTTSESMSAGTHALTSSEATFSGTGAGSASAVATASATYLSNNYSGSFLFGTNSLAFKITLTQALAEGDIISFTGYGKELCFTTTNTRSTSISTTDYTYTIPSGSPLIDATEFYVWRATSGNTYFNDFTIVTSGAVTSTYSVSFDLSSIADEIEGLTEQTALPNPLPTPENVASGYTFERWYTDAAFTTAATAGAAINTNTTLYANFIMDTPTITPAAGDIYANTTMTLSSDIPFTTAYGRWKTTGEADTKTTLTGFTPMYSGDVTGSFSGFTTATTPGSQYFSYMISDGKFYSRPATTEEYTVSNKITIAAPLSNATYIVGETAVAPLTISAADTREGATLSYQWKSSSDGSSWDDAPGASNDPSYTPIIGSAGTTTYYKCIVSSTSDAAAVESNVATVTVNAAEAYTVSFDTGIGSGDNIADRTQGSSGAPIELPSVTVSSSDNYEFEGWYDGSTRIGGAGSSYKPASNITLTAKYNCKVTLATAGGSGTVSAVKTSDGTPVGDKVLEGTEITLTATPTSVNEFVSWSGNASGTTNPVTIEVSDVTSVTANFSVSEYEELFHTTFTTGDGWDEGSVNVLSGSTGNVVEKTINGTKVTFAGKSGTSYTLNVNTNNNKLTYGGSNLNASAGSSTPNCYMAIHLTGVNGSITVDFGSSSQKWIYALDDGNTGAITTGKTQLGAAQTSFTLDNLQSSNVILYLGNKNLSTNEITITTPKTRLVADSAQVRFIGTAGGAVPVRISTNSPGAVSIKTAPNSTYANAVYNSTTKILTVTPVAVGETSVTLQVAQSGDYPAKELTIPIKVVAKTITIKTQPANLTCYQNESTEKKFTVAATVNTGNELTYQWYTCDDANKTNESAISGAIETSYVVNTTAKATVGAKYYFCRVTSATDNISLDTEVKTLTVTALAAGGTYNGTVYLGNKGNELTYTSLGDVTKKTDTGTTYYDTTLSSGTLTITSKGSATGSGVITLSDNTVINVTVKKHTIQLIWSADSKVYTNKSASDKDTELPLDNGSNNGLPTLTRLYEDGTAYKGKVDFYVDDTSIAYFGTEGTNKFEAATPSSKPTIKYGGGQGGCKFYAFIDHNWSSDAEDVKASYDLRVQQGYSNSIPESRAVDVQQQYTMWKDADTKLITVTYGGYKYNNHAWGGKTDSWGTATNYVGKDNAIDGFLYAVRNKERDASDEYMHAVNHLDDNNESAWYANGEGGATADYQRIKPFRLPCRASYLTFYAHKSGTLTAYVYQNGIIGNGGAENKLATGPRLGYWFDEEGWVQTPTATVVTKQKIANANARDKRAYGNYDNMDEQLATWTNTDDAIVVRKLRSKYCKSATNLTDNLDDYELDNVATHDEKKYPDKNPYYWGKSTDVTANNAAIMPMPERPIPHQGGHMIVNEGYVKYTIHVDAGKTYYFFGKMTKVGYAGMNFVEDASASENRQSSRVDLATDDKWSEKFDTHASSVLVGDKTTIYNEITVPSNYRIGMWNTICLPFAVNENQVEQVFGKGTELAIFDGLRHDTENHVYYIKYLRHVDQNILPGQPYLIYPTGRAVAERSNQDNGGMAETGENVPTVDGIIGSTIDGSDGATRLTFKNVIINKGITAQSYGCNIDAGGTTASYVFTGTDKRTPIVKYDIYNTPKTGELKRYMGTGTNLNTYHALMKAYSEDIKQDAITFAFSEDDVEKSWESNIDDDEPGDPTGIVIIEDEGTSDVRYSGKVTNGKSYNMMGQQVDPTSAKGIVIINGKKVMY